MSDTSPTQRNLFIRPFLWIGSRPAAIWTRLRPERRTLRAISFSTYVATIALGCYWGYRIRLSSDLQVLFGYEGPPILGARERFFDIAAGAAASFLAVLVAWLLFALVLRLGKWLPTATGRFGVGALIALACLFDESGLASEEALAFAAIVVLIVAAIFGSIASLTSGKFGAKGRLGKTMVWVFGLLGLASAGTIGYGALHQGTVDHLTAIPAYAAASEPAKLTVSDPGKPGPHADKIASLTYGSGTDIHRPEFGAGATLKTKTVNGKPFAKLPSGRKGKKRELFWQFPLSEMPINGRVWYPKGNGPFPLALIVHGNHSMREFSDPGYQYLGTHLASHGFILCSVDQNFINGNMKKENDARGWLLLEHLKVWKKWNATEGSPFFGKVDMDNIALMGHSRGGEAVTHAALFNTLKHYPDDASVTFDFGFSIKSVVSIAPVDGQYKPAGRYTRLRDVNYFTIHGSHDADVTQFQGDRIYNRLTFSEGSNYFKSTLYVYRANHGQFNTVWGPTDSGPPRSLLLNRAALLDGEAQRQVAKVYITAFLLATLRSERDYLPLFVNPRRGRDWLPEVTLISRFEDASFRVIADYEEDADVTTTTIPGGEIRAKGLVVYREGDISLRGSSNGGSGTRFNQGAYLGWNTEPAEDGKPAEAVAAEAAGKKTPDAGSAPPPEYEIELPEGFMSGLKLTGEEQLVIHIAEVDEKPKAKDYSAKVEDGDENDDESDDENDPPKKGPVRPALDFSVELLTAARAVRFPLSRYGMLVPPLKAETSRASFLGRSPSKTEITLQVFTLPLAGFKAVEPAFEPSAVTGIRLVFDRQQKGVVVIDRIGIADRPK